MSPLPRINDWTPPRAFDLERVWPWIAASRRKAIRLHPVAAAQMLPANASKMGGAFLWPAAEPWPHCRERDAVLDWMPPITWERFVEISRESKLSERMVKSGLVGEVPKLSGDFKADSARWEEASRKLEQLYERERTKGLPKLTPAEVAEAKQAFALEQKMDARRRLPHNTPYAPILQLRRDDFPELPWPPGQDLFQLLWCPQVHFEGNGMHDADEKPTQTPGYVAKWRTERLVGKTLAAMPKLEEPFQECGLQPEDVIEYPQANEFDPEEIEPHLRTMEPWLARVPHRGQLIPNAGWRYSQDLAAAPGTKLLGHPRWIHGDETPECASCGERMRLLLTCASREEVDSPAWSAARFHASQEKYENPHGLRWGNAYLFYCARCKPLRLASVVQTS